MFFGFFYVRVSNIRNRKENLDLDSSDEYWILFYFPLNVQIAFGYYTFIKLYECMYIQKYIYLLFIFINVLLYVSNELKFVKLKIFYCKLLYHKVEELKINWKPPMKSKSKFLFLFHLYYSYMYVEKFKK